MSIKISGTDVIDNNQRGIFLKVNPGVYTTSARNALSASAGDVIYNSDDQELQVYTGTEWRSVGGKLTATDISGARLFYYENGYYYASFTSPGTITMDGYGEVEVFLVGGGGGGGAGRLDGGGGAGGVLVTPAPASPGPYTITIGSGGIGQSSWTGFSAADASPPGSRGGDTTAFGQTAKGGGIANTGLKPGGSGSGGGSNNNVAGNGTAGQGYPGGAGTNNFPGDENTFTGGGGGGAGGPGQSVPAVSTTPGIGGVGMDVPTAAPGWVVPFTAVPTAPGFAGGGSGAGGKFPSTNPRPPVGFGAGGWPGTGGASALINSGSGGGAGGFRADTNYGGGNGGSGFAVIRWAST